MSIKYSFYFWFETVQCNLNLKYFLCHVFIFKYNQNVFSLSFYNCLLSIYESVALDCAFALRGYEPQSGRSAFNMPSFKLTITFFNALCLWKYINCRLLKICIILKTRLITSQT